jgi:hypothetical protein
MRIGGFYNAICLCVYIYVWIDVHQSFFKAEDASAQVMVSSQQQLGWFGQCRGRGTNFLKRSISGNKFISPPKKEKTVEYFSAFFLLLSFKFTIN